jgi:hypothetical protein
MDINEHKISSKWQIFFLPGMCQQILLQPSIAKFHIHMFNRSRVIAREQKEQVFKAFATGIMKPKGSH